MKFLNVILPIYFLLLLTTSVATAAPTCIDLFRGSQVDKVEILPNELVKSLDFSRLNRRVQPISPLGIDLNQVVPGKNRVVLGIEKRRHIVLIVDDIRYDGRMLHDPQPTIFKNEMPVGQGVFISFENLPMDLVYRLKDQLLRPAKTAYFGCGQAALAMLAEVGIVTSRQNEFLYSTSQIFDLIQRRDFYFLGGKPLSATVYATADMDIPLFAKQLEKFDQEVLNTIQKDYKAFTPEGLIESITGRNLPIDDRLRQFLARILNPMLPNH